MLQSYFKAAKNIRGFITHGGLLSIQEAITYGVPMIAFPLFAEQEYNAYRLELTGRGIKLEIQTLTLKDLDHAISQLLTIKTYVAIPYIVVFTLTERTQFKIYIYFRYKSNVEKVSRLFKDRISKPIETAVWWTEYVLRNPDSDHLKPLAIHQYWFQRRLLDVWGLLLLVFLAVAALKIYILKSICSYFCSVCSSSTSKEVTTKKIKTKTKVKKN